MTRRRTMPAAGAVLTALALLAVGCSSSGSQPDSAVQHPAVQHDTDAAADPDATADTDADSDADPDADSDAPAVPGGEDPDAEAAPLAPGYEHGSKITSLRIKGYPASIDVLALPSTPAVKKPWEETPTPHPVKGGEDATTVGAQTTAGKAKPPKLTVNVAGLDYSTWGAGHPPDTSGAVGPKQFVQTVNTSIGVYDKTGKQLNAFTYNTFFGQFHTGTPCDNQNGGDPQVIFDRPANKWIIADLSYPSGGPYYFCMAVSNGREDHRQEVDDVPVRRIRGLAQRLPEDRLRPQRAVPHLEHVPQLPGVHRRRGVGVRAQLARAPSRSTSRRCAPAPRTAACCRRTPTPPPRARGPEYLTSLESSTSIGLWKYNVNWQKPSKSTFTQTPQLITVDSYQPAGSVPRKAGQPMDSLSDRPMYQLQKATDGTLWFDHSVQVGTRPECGGTRSGTSPRRRKVLQQSTYAPKDGLSRWMGSLAVDKVGNMAVGLQHRRHPPRSRASTTPPG